MATREDYSEHHRPYVDDRGFLSPRFYDPEVTHEQYFRYESTPPWSDSEARIRFREFSYLGYVAISHIEFIETSDGKDIPLRSIIENDGLAQDLVSRGALIGPRAIDYPEINRTELLPGVMFFMRQDNPSLQQINQEEFHVN